MQWKQLSVVADLIHQGPWYKHSGLLWLNICLLVPLMTSALNGFDSSVLNGLQIVPEFKTYFNNPGSTSIGLMIAAQNIGALIALPFAALATDGVGRRMTLFGGSTVMVAGVVVQAWTTRIEQFIVARGIVGLGLTFCCNAAPLLITELAYPTQRGKITSLYNSCWYLGSIIAAWVTYATYEKMTGSVWSWKIPIVIQAGPSMLQMLLVWFIPESPRWLISKGRDAQALATLAKYHALGDRNDPLVMFEYAQIRQALRLEQEVAETTSYLTLFKTPGNRKRMRIVIAIGLFSQWSGNGLVSFYIDRVLEAVGFREPDVKAQINGGLQIWNFIIAVTAAMLVERLGRRPLFITSTTGMFASFSMWTLTTALYQTQGNIVAARATVGIIFAFYMFYDIAFTPILVAYTIEILPFRIRARGFAVMNFVVCLTLAFNQFINPFALDSLQWKYYLVYCGWLLFEIFFVIRYIIETRGRTLEETAALFDGQQHLDDLQHIASVAATQSVNLREEVKFRSQHLATKPSDEDLFHIREEAMRATSIAGKYDLESPSGRRLRSGSDAYPPPPARPEPLITVARYRSPEPYPDSPLKRPSLGDGGDDIFTITEENSQQLRKVQPQPQQPHYISRRVPKFSDVSSRYSSSPPSSSGEPKAI